MLVLVPLVAWYLLSERRAALPAAGPKAMPAALALAVAGRHMIDTAIHHRGGPIFFALSLIPFFLVLWWLRRGEGHTSAFRTG